MKQATTYPVLTPDEAKELLRRKGWSNKALAVWWGFSDEYISRLINNAARKRRDDDALRGLPTRKFMYDILEVLFFHRPGADKQATLDRLQEALNGDFEVEGHEFVTEMPFDESRQVVRIIASNEEFESGLDFEERVRELASEDEFQWQRIGAVPVGGTETVLC